MTGSPATYYALRLKPGQDLKIELLAFAEKHQLKAAFVATCNGSLQQASLRFADCQEGMLLDNKFEIVSLVGTIGNGAAHLHMSIADSDGQVTGGHLLNGNLIYTTAEIVIGEITGLNFARRQDAQTGYNELLIELRN